MLVCSVFSGLDKESVDPFRVHALQCREMPAWLQVLVDQQCPDALGKLTHLQAAFRYLKLLVENLGQAVVQGVVIVLPGQSQGRRRRRRPAAASGPVDSTKIRLEKI